MKTAEEKKVVKALTIISVRVALSIVGRAVSDIGSDASVRESIETLIWWRQEKMDDWKFQSE